MPCRTIFPKIHIKSVIFFLQSQLLHAGSQLIIIIFPLASSDDLPDSRNKTVYCCNRFIVIIHLHIESFDILRIVRYKYRTLVNFLCQITFMFCLKICSPGYFIFKFIIVLFQYFNRFCISHSREVRRNDIIQTVKKSFIYKRIEEIHLFRRIFQHIADHVFQHGFCKSHIIIKICKGHLRLDHPELCRMSCRIGIFRTERGSERINIPESLGVSLSV